MATIIPAGFRALPLPIAQLSLPAVLKCGQSFRWTVITVPPLAAVSGVVSESEADVEYRFALKDRVICLRQSPETLFYRSLFPNTQGVNEMKENETLVWLQDYFQLDVDLIKLYDTWSDMDPVFSRLRDRFVGIRMLRQDPWENLISFICSQNNHISRITSMVQALCTQFSPVLLSESSCSPSILNYHAFPSPSLLAAPGTSATLRALGFGYRAEYIQRTAEMLVDAHGADGTETFLEGLRRMSTADARQELLRLMGVGRKVADCVLLMSLNKHEVVPVDTHVHKIAVKHYGFRGAGDKMNAKLYEDVQVKLAGVWGGHAGWAHSVLFTADLKSFSSYGLPTPSPSVSPEKPKAKKTKATLPKSPPLSPAKRKRTSTEKLKFETMAVDLEKSSLADRVKRRRTRSALISYVELAVA